MVTDRMQELCTTASCLHGHVFWTLMMMITLVVEQVQTAEMLLSHCFGNGWELWVLYAVHNKDESVLLHHQFPL